MRDKPRNGRISFAQRERHRRGRRAVGCEVSGRWLRFGRPFDPGFLEGDAVYVDVLSDSYDDDDLSKLRTRKLTSLMISVEDLRTIVELFDEERIDGLDPS
jgi:hypothetical protein